MDRHLALAYSWGKWLALRADDYRKAMEFYKAQRPRRNWGILVEHDEMALRYQRCEFRLRRAMLAVGAWGMTGYATFGEENPNSTVTLCGVEFPVHAASTAELDQMNRDDFQRNHRSRATKAKQVAEDKRHPLAHFSDVQAEEDQLAYEQEVRSGRW